MGRQFVDAAHHPLCSNSAIRAGRTINAQTRARVNATTSNSPKLAMPGCREKLKAPKDAIEVKALKSTAWEVLLRMT